MLILGNNTTHIEGAKRRNKDNEQEKARKPGEQGRMSHGMERRRREKQNELKTISLPTKANT